MAMPFSSVSASRSDPAIHRPAGSDSTAELVVRVERFDIQSEREWAELIRDILAVANSGGGRIYLTVAVEENEVYSNLERYTDSTFTDVRVVAGVEPEVATAVIVGQATIPLAFSPQEGRDATAAAARHVAPGFYFRRGGRSEPGTTADMRSFVARLLHRVRRRWLRGIRRVLAGPMTFDVGAAPKRRGKERIRLERAVLQPVRIVADPNAPALQPQDVEQLYPWRQKDLLGELNARLGRRALNSYDIQAVRRHHRLDERPEFVFNLPGAGRRYSPAAADWIMEQYGRNPDFFRQARAADQALLKLRRKKPR